MCGVPTNFNRKHWIPWLLKLEGFTFKINRTKAGCRAGIASIIFFRYIWATIRSWTLWYVLMTGKKWCVGILAPACEYMWSTWFGGLGHSPDWPIQIRMTWCLPEKILAIELWALLWSALFFFYPFIYIQATVWSFRACFCNTEDSLMPWKKIWFLQVPILLQLGRWFLHGKRNFWGSGVHPLGHWIRMLIIM